LGYEYGVFYVFGGEFGIGQFGGDEGGGWGVAGEVGEGGGEGGSLRVFCGERDLGSDCNEKNYDEGKTGEEKDS